MDRPDHNLAVYVHWPFCVSKCPYCDFNSHVAEKIDHARWRAAFAAELDHYAHETIGRTVTSIFFGGGTPSLMDPETVAAVIDGIGQRWKVAETLEITLEANPSSAEAGRFRAFAGAGVNRLSLGVQSLDDEALKFLGRAHSATDALAALSLAQEVFPRVSFDMIYALPGQSQEAWRVQLGRALELAGGHMSLYQLTIETGTPFFRDGVAAADDDDGATLYEITQDMTAAAGLPAYEISNHARPGEECRHNLTYWQGGAYVGIGPGAHGRLVTGHAWRAPYQISNPDRWLAAVEARGHGTAKPMALEPAARREELIMTGLRLTEGIGRRQFRDLTGMEPEEAVNGDGLGHMTEAGFVEVDDHGLRATPAGLQRLNGVLRALLV